MNLCCWPFRPPCCVWFHGWLWVLSVCLASYWSLRWLQVFTSVFVSVVDTPTSSWPSAHTYTNSDAFSIHRICQRSPAAPQRPWRNRHQMQTVLLFCRMNTCVRPTVELFSGRRFTWLVLFIVRSSCSISSFIILPCEPPQSRRINAKQKAVLVRHLIVSAVQSLIGL